MSGVVCVVCPFCMRVYVGVGVCMYICIDIYVCVCMYVCMHVYMYEGVYMYMYLYMWVCMCVYVYMYMGGQYLYRCIRTHGYVCRRKKYRTPRDRPIATDVTHVTILQFLDRSVYFNYHGLLGGARHVNHIAIGRTKRHTPDHHLLGSVHERGDFLTKRGAFRLK